MKNKSRIAKIRMFAVASLLCVGVVFGAILTANKPIKQWQEQSIEKEIVNAALTDVTADDLWGETLVYSTATSGYSATYTLEQGYVYFFDIYGARGGKGGAQSTDGYFGGRVYGYYDMRWTPNMVVTCETGRAGGGGNAGGASISSYPSRSGGGGGAGAAAGVGGSTGSTNSYSSGTYETTYISGGGGGGGGGSSGIKDNAKNVWIATAIGGSGTGGGSVSSGGRSAYGGGGGAGGGSNNNTDLESLTGGSTKYAGTSIDPGWASNSTYLRAGKIEIKRYTADLRKPLTDKIAEAATYLESDWSFWSWGPFVKAKADATKEWADVQDAYYNDIITIGTVTNTSPSSYRGRIAKATTDLDNAIKALKGDPTELYKTYLELWNKYSQYADYYGNWSTLNTQFLKANDYLEDTTGTIITNLKNGTVPDMPVGLLPAQQFTKAQYTQMVSDLKSAAAGLTITKVALQTAVNNAEALKRAYWVDGRRGNGAPSWETQPNTLVWLDKKLDNARLSLFNATPTVQEIKRSTEELIDAINRLRYILTPMETAILRAKVYAGILQLPNGFVLADVENGNLTAASFVTSAFEASINASSGYPLIDNTTVLSKMTQTTRDNFIAAMNDALETYILAKYRTSPATEDITNANWDAKQNMLNSRLMQLAFETTTLKGLYNVAIAKDKKYYTPSTFNDLVVATQAAALYVNAGSVQPSTFISMANQIGAVTATLETAINSLEFNFDQLGFMDNPGQLYSSVAPGAGESWLFTKDKEVNGYNAYQNETMELIKLYNLAKNLLWIGGVSNDGPLLTAIGQVNTLFNNSAVNLHDEYDNETALSEGRTGINKSLIDGTFKWFYDQATGIDINSAFLNMLIKQGQAFEKIYYASDCYDTLQSFVRKTASGNQSLGLAVLVYNETLVFINEVKAGQGTHITATEMFDKISKAIDGGTSAGVNYGIGLQKAISYMRVDVTRFRDYWLRSDNNGYGFTEDVNSGLFRVNESNFVDISTYTALIADVVTKGFHQKTDLGEFPNKTDLVIINNKNNIYLPLLKDLEATYWALQPNRSPLMAAIADAEAILNIASYSMKGTIYQYSIYSTVSYSTLRSAITAARASYLKTTVGLVEIRQQIASLKNARDTLVVVTNTLDNLKAQALDALGGGTEKAPRYNKTNYDLLMNASAVKYSETTLNNLYDTYMAIVNSPIGLGVDSGNLMITQVTQLAASISQLGVSVQVIELLLQKANQLIEGGHANKFESNSWQFFTSEYNRVRNTVNAGSISTTTEVTNLYNTLSNAIMGLEFSFSVLNDAITASDTYTKYKNFITTETYSEFETTLATAKGLKNITFPPNETAGQMIDEYLLAFGPLTTILNKLNTLPGDFKTSNAFLNGRIDTILGELEIPDRQSIPPTNPRYTGASWTAFNTRINDSINRVGLSNQPYNALYNSWDLLEKSYALLSVNKNDLGTLIATYAGKAQGDYPNTAPEHAWNNFQDAIAAAQVVYDKPDGEVTYTQVQAAMNTLRKALNTLELAKLQMIIDGGKKYQKWSNYYTPETYSALTSAISAAQIVHDDIANKLPENINNIYAAQQSVKNALPPALMFKNTALTDLLVLANGYWTQKDVYTSESLGVLKNAIDYGTGKENLATDNASYIKACNDLISAINGLVSLDSLASLLQERIDEFDEFGREDYTVVSYLEYKRVVELHGAKLDDQTGNAVAGVTTDNLIDAIREIEAARDALISVVALREKVEEVYNLINDGLEVGIDDVPIWHIDKSNYTQASYNSVMTQISPERNWEWLGTSSVQTVLYYGGIDETIQIRIANLDSLQNTLVNFSELKKFMQDLNGACTSYSYISTFKDIGAWQVSAASAIAPWKHTFENSTVASVNIISETASDFYNTYVRGYVSNNEIFGPDAATINDFIRRLRNQLGINPLNPTFPGVLVSTEKLRNLIKDYVDINNSDLTVNPKSTYDVETNKHEFRFTQASLENLVTQLHLVDKGTDVKDRLFYKGTYMDLYGTNDASGVGGVYGKIATAINQLVDLKELRDLVSALNVQNKNDYTEITWLAYNAAASAFNDANYYGQGANQGIKDKGTKEDVAALIAAIKDTKDKLISVNYTYNYMEVVDGNNVNKSKDFNLNNMVKSDSDTPDIDIQGAFNGDANGEASNPIIDGKIQYTTHSYAVFAEAFKTARDTAKNGNLRSEVIAAIINLFTAFVGLEEYKDPNDYLVLESKIKELSPLLSKGDQYYPENFTDFSDAMKAGSDLLESLKEIVQVIQDGKPVWLDDNGADTFIDTGRPKPTLDENEEPLKRYKSPLSEEEVAQIGVAYNNLMSKYYALRIKKDDLIALYNIVSTWADSDFFDKTKPDTDAAWAAFKTAVATANDAINNARLTFDAYEDAMANLVGSNKKIGTMINLKFNFAGLKKLVDEANNVLSPKNKGIFGNDEKFFEDLTEARSMANNLLIQTGGLYILDVNVNNYIRFSERWTNLETLIGQLRVEPDAVRILIEYINEKYDTYFGRNADGEKDYRINNNWTVLDFNEFKKFYDYGRKIIDPGYINPATNKPLEYTEYYYVWNGLTEAMNKNDERIAEKKIEDLQEYIDNTVDKYDEKYYNALRYNDLKRVLTNANNLIVRAQGDTEDIGDMDFGIMYALIEYIEKSLIPEDNGYGKDQKELDYNLYVFSKEAGKVPTPGTNVAGPNGQIDWGSPDGDTFGRYATLVDNLTKVGKNVKLSTDPADSKKTGTIAEYQDAIKTFKDAVKALLATSKNYDDTGWITYGTKRVNEQSNPDWIQEDYDKAVEEGYEYEVPETIFDLETDYDVIVKDDTAKNLAEYVKSPLYEIKKFAREHVIVPFFDPNDKSCVPECKENAIQKAVVDDMIFLFNKKKYEPIKSPNPITLPNGTTQADPNVHDLETQIIASVNLFYRNVIKLILIPKGDAEISAKGGRDNITPTTLKAYDEELQFALHVYNDFADFEFKTYYLAIEEAQHRFSMAIAGLKQKADKTALEAAIKNAYARVEELGEMNIIPATYEKLVNALIRAEQVFADGDATQEEVAEATAELNRCVADLLLIAPSQSISMGLIIIICSICGAVVLCFFLAFINHKLKLKRMKLYLRAKEESDKALSDASNKVVAAGIANKLHKADMGDTEQYQTTVSAVGDANKAVDEAVKKVQEAKAMKKKFHVDEKKLKKLKEKEEKLAQKKGKKKEGNNDAKN